jgi:hypothetical protein
MNNSNQNFPSLILFRRTNLQAGGSQRSSALRRTVGCCLRTLAFFVVPLFVALSGRGDQPTIFQTLIDTNNNTVSITTTGTPGDLQFLCQSFVAPFTNLLHNAIRISSVDTNGYGHFTADLTDGNAFFQARTVPHPTTLGGGTNDIKVFDFPEDVTVADGDTAAFMVVAQGTITDQLEYQWYKNGVAIPSATNSQYSLTATLTDSGSSYSCDINMVGYPPVRVGSSAIASSGAQLFVADSPPLVSVRLGGGTNEVEILAFPRHTVVTNTGTASFVVVAQGTVTNQLQYQWFWNEIPITNNPTATSSNLVITNAQYDANGTSATVLSSNSNVGFYSCDVNMVGHPAVRVRSADTNSIGAVLSVYIGSNTTYYAPYAPQGGGTCPATYAGYVRFRSLVTPTSTNYFFTPTAGANWCKIKDLTVITPTPPAPGYVRTVWFAAGCLDSCTTGPYFVSSGSSCATFPVCYVAGTALRCKFSTYVHSPSTIPLGAQFTLDMNWSTDLLSCP